MTLESNPYGPYVRESLPNVIPAEEVAIFSPTYNTGNKRDATGAFILEAKRFADLWNIPRDKIKYVDNRLAKSVHRDNNVADDFLDKMEERQKETKKPIAIWVFFCHGYTHGIQFSIRSPGHRHFDSEYEARYLRFLDIISKHNSPLVILYACSTGDDPDGDPDTAPGSGDRSFGDLLRDDLCKRGAIFNRVVSHTTAGHTTRNPFVKVFDGKGSPIGDTGGELIATPGTKEFRKFRAKLKFDFRFQFPFLTVNKIREQLV